MRSGMEVGSAHQPPAQSGEAAGCVLALAHGRLTHQPTPARLAWGPEALGLGTRAGQWVHSGYQLQSPIVLMDTACLRAKILALTPQGA